MGAFFVVYFVLEHFKASSKVHVYSSITAEYYVS